MPEVGVNDQDALVAEAGDVLADLFEGDFVEPTMENTAPVGDQALAAEQPRDEKGRFASTVETVPEVDPSVGTTEAPESAAEPVVEPVAEGQPEGTPEIPLVEEVDELSFELPEDHILFTKYGGDIDKALAALEESQAFIGKQSDELGELRQLRDEMSQFRGEISSKIQSSQIDWDAYIAESPQAAAETAVSLGDGEKLVDALRAWAEEDPISPVLYLQGLQQELASAPAPTAQPTETIEQTVGALAAKHTDLPQFLPAISEMAAERPQFARALAEGTPRDRAQALEDLYHLAKSRTVESDTSAAKTRVILKAAKAAETAKAEAAVVGASNASAASAAPAPSETETLQADLRTLTGLDDLVVL